MHRVPSSDGVAVAVHELGGERDAPPLLLSHATGFHAHCYAPIGARLGAHYRAVGLDYRGHGLTPAPPGWQVDWARFGDDALVVAQAVAPEGGLVAFGHSMGGAALLMAAHRAPQQFAHLVLFEPIAVPDDARRAPIEDHPLVTGARRRRRVFAPYQDAIDNFRDKRPLSEMTPEVLRLYVEHGFEQLVVDGEPAGVTLRCPPEIEAAIFAASRENGVWQLLPEITTPVTVVSGIVEEQQPSGACAAIAARLPQARSVVLPHQGHLGPFSHPDEVADLVVAELGAEPLRRA